LPLVRIMDAAVYIRPCDGGFLWGGYEEDPQPIDMDSVGAGFEVKDVTLDAAVLRRLGADVARQFPVLGAAKVREHRGGIPTMTADGQHLVGPVPGASGFFVASGCNVAGLSVSPAIGEAVAAWILDGAPPLDLTPFAITRFGPEARLEAHLRRDAAWQYRHFYGSV
jgi:glycine/D-amino acid oxidase-like deaminating enzyme